MAGSDERRKEIERQRGLGLTGRAAATGTAQALRDPGKSFRDYWDSNNLPGPAKALLGVGKAALTGVTDLANLDQDAGRAATGVLVYSASFLPGNDPEEVARVRAAYEQTDGSVAERALAANEAFAQGNEFLAGLANMALSPSSLATAGGAGVAKLGAQTGLPVLARAGRAAAKAGDVAQAIEGLPLKPLTYPLGKVAQAGIRKAAGTKTGEALAAGLARKLTPGQVIQAADAPAQIALPGMRDLPGAAVDPRTPRMVQQALPLGEVPPPRLAPGGIVPPSGLRTPHGIAPDPALGGGSPLGMMPQIAKDYSRRVAGTTTLDSLVAPQEAQDFTQTPHLGLLESVRRIAEGRVPGREGGPFDSPFNLSPGLAQDLTGQAPATGPSGIPLTPPLGLAQQARSRYQQAHLNDPARVATDIAANKELARQSYLRRVGTAEGFEPLWDRVNDWIEQTKTISMGVGSADSARRIIEGTKDKQGNVIRAPSSLMNGMALHGVRAGEDLPLSLVDAKAAALGLGGGDRKKQAIAFGAALGITNPREAVRAYARHFLTIEAGSFGKAGLGDPTKVADAINGMYASVHEGQPNLQQMGGGIHLLIDPHTTEYTTSVHHPFSFESPGVLPMHEGTSVALKDTFGPERQAELAQAAGRPAMQRFGPAGEYEISGSPMLVGPAATNAARAAALFMTEGGPLFKIARSGDPADIERAAALMIRGAPAQGRGFSQEVTARRAAAGLDVPPPSPAYSLAQSSSQKRTETLVHNLTPENITGVVVRGKTEATVAENAQAARDLMAHYGIDAPIYIAWGPEGDPNPGVYRLDPEGPVPATLNEGRARLIDTIKNLGEENLGATPGIAPEARQANAIRFMEGVHPLLKNIDGTPKVFYHGTMSGDFDRFTVPERPGDFGHGIYVSQDPAYASMYAGDPEMMQFHTHYGNDNRVEVGDAGSNVKPVYVNLRNPYIWGDNPALDAQMASRTAREGLREKLQALGYDGVIAQKSMYYGREGDRNAIEEMVVFDPAAIKSATGNSGAFDPNDPRLLGVGGQQPPPPRAAVQRQGQNPVQWLNTPVLTGVPGGTRLGVAGSTGLAGAAIGGTQGDTDEERRQNAIQGFGAGAALAGGPVSARGYNLLRNTPIVTKAAKGLLSEAVAAQRAAMSRKGQGFAALKQLPNVWKVQATSTLRNLLQDEATARLWLADAGVRTQMMNDNWASLIDLYNQGVRDPYLSLPQDTTTVLDALGLHGYVPDVGASFTEANKRIVDSLSAGDTARLEAGLSLLNPLQGGIPVLGVLAAGAKGYTRAFQQSLFDTLNMFTRAASRHAAFQDTIEKELPGVADAFIRTHGLAPLAGRDGLFAPQEVEALVPGLGPLWQHQVDTIVARAEARAKDILGDYARKLPGEGAVSSVFPFVSYALRAYPRTAKLMLHHPGASLVFLLAMVKGAEWSKQQGLPGYLAGTVPLGEDTPVVGGLVSALGGGTPGTTAYANPAAALAPVDASLFAADDLPQDANAYQQAAGVADRLGFSFNPIIKAGAAAVNADYRMPGAMSRTAAVEQVMPGPQIPSLAQGPINFVREQAGGSALETTGLDRRIAQVFYRATGHAINDPEVERDPRLAALAASTLDPDSPLVRQALDEERRAAVAKVGVGMTSPVSVTAQTAVQGTQNRARQAVAALPPAAVDPATIRQLQRAHDLNSQYNAARYARLNVGTQGAPPPEAGITSGVSRKARAYAALAAWQRENAGLAQFAPAYYQELEQQLRATLGLP